MGIYTNLITGGQTLKAAKPRVGLGRASAEFLLNAKNDSAAATGFTAADEIQTLVEQTDAGVGDTYTLTISLPRLLVGTFTTAAIAYDAINTTIETAIDVAATAAGVTDWTNADISVAMGAAAGLDDGNITLTFDGDSVTGQPVAVSVLTATGFTKSGVFVRGTSGQPIRNASQALFELGIVAGTLNNCLAAPTDWVKPTATVVKKPRMNVIKDIMCQVDFENGNSLTSAVIAVLYPELP